MNISWLKILCASATGLWFGVWQSNVHAGLFMYCLVFTVLVYFAKEDFRP